MNNYLKNRFKLDGNLYCKNSKIQKELNVISLIRKEMKEPDMFSVDYEQLLKFYEK